MNFQIAHVASILNRFLQTRYHFKALNLLFPNIYKFWWFTWSYESCKSLWTCELSWCIGNRNHQELQRITPKMISEWFVNHQESLRIHPKTISDWFVNHWEHQKLPQKRFQSGLRITENCWESPIIAPKTISDWFANHQESPRITENHPKTISEWFHESSRITENHCESLRIKPKTISDWSPRIIKNCQESMRIAPNNDFRMVCKSLRITKNPQELPPKQFHWESLRVIENGMAENHQELIQKWFQTDLQITENCQESHKKIRSYLFNCPRLNDTDAWRSLYL